MIIRIQFKDPDCFVTVDGDEGHLGLSNKEMDAVCQFVEWGEYATIEVDTKTGEAKVLTCS